MQEETPMTGEERLRRVRARFYVVDGVFKLSWVISVPTYFIYLNALLDDSTKAMTVVLSIYLTSLLLEATLGAIADVIKGPTSFYFACAFTAAGASMYAAGLLLTPWDNGESILLYFVACELVGNIGFTMFSGSFERWFSTTLELANEKRRPAEVFGRLRTLRNFWGLVGGLIGIYIFSEFFDHFDHRRSPKIVWLLLVPHTWAFVLRSLALFTAWRVRSYLDRDDLPIAGARTVREIPTRRTLLQLTADARRALDQGWSVVVKSRVVSGALQLAAAYQLLLTVTSFFVPLFLWRISPILQASFEDNSLVLTNKLFLLSVYWALTQAARVGGAWVSRRFETKPELTALGAALVGGLCMLAAGCLLGYPSWAPGVFVALALVIASVFCLGLMEPPIDAMLQDHAPPDLRSIVVSYKAMVASFVCVPALLLVHFVSLWNSDGGQYSQELMLASAGAVAITIALSAGATLRSFAEPTAGLVIRWLARVSPLVVIITAAAVGSLLAWLDAYGMPELAAYRKVIGASDQWAYWPAHVADHKYATKWAGPTASVLAFVIFVVGPLAAMYRFVTARLVARPHRRDTSIALRVMDEVHREVRDPLHQLVARVAPTQVELRRPGGVELVAAPMYGLDADGDLADRPVSAFDRGAVLAYFSAVHHELNGIAQRMREVRRIAVDQSEEDSRYSRDPYAAAQQAILALGVRQDEGGDRFLMRIREDDDNERFSDVLIELCIVPDRFDPGRTTPVERCRAHPRGLWVYLPIFESLRNAAQAVIRARAAGAMAAAGQDVADIQVKIHVTHSTIWVFIVDRGPGLPAGVEHRGMGLYICRALARLGACSYSLENGYQGGALVRIMFDREPGGGE